MVKKIKTTKNRYTPYLIIGLFVIIDYLFFYSSILLTILPFILLILIFLYFKYDSRILVGFAIIILLLAGVILSITQNSNFANLFAIYAYWLLVVGVVCLIIDYIRERKGNER